MLAGTNCGSRKQESTSPQKLTTSSVLYDVVKLSSTIAPFSPTAPPPLLYGPEPILPMPSVPARAGSVPGWAPAADNEEEEEEEEG